MSGLLEVEDLHVSFGGQKTAPSHVIRGVDLSLKAGERLGLVGESGCGKSTTIMAIMGLLPSNATVSGRVLLDGEELLQGGERAVRPHRWRDIAIIFQGSMNTFNPVRRVNLQIADAITARRGVSREDARRRAGALLEMVGIPTRRVTSFPHELSGGMRQRASIALALGCEPRILLADEPTTALDVIVQAQIMKLLARLCEEQELALVLVSHDLALVLEMCSRVEVMYAGRIIESSGSKDLYESSAHPYTELMLASTLYVHEDAVVRSIPGAPPSPLERVVGCSFRPRCDRAFSRCELESPALLSVGPGHAAACHLNTVAGKPPGREEPRGAA